MSRYCNLVFLHSLLVPLDCLHGIRFGLDLVSNVLLYFQFNNIRIDLMSIVSERRFAVTYVF